MVKITAKVDGMMCGMCEAHVNDAVRAAFPRIKKVTSSHTAGETVILSEESLDQEQVRTVLLATGYTIGEITEEPYEKKGLFARLRG